MLPQSVIQDFTNVLNRLKLSVYYFQFVLENSPLNFLFRNPNFILFIMDLFEKLTCSLSASSDDYKKALLYLSRQNVAAVESIRKLLAARAGTALAAEKFDLDYATLELILSLLQREDVLEMLACLAQSRSLTGGDEQLNQTITLDDSSIEVVDDSDASVTDDSSTDSTESDEPSIVAEMGDQMKALVVSVRGPQEE